MLPTGPYYDAERDLGFIFNSDAGTVPASNTATWRAMRAAAQPSGSFPLAGGVNAAILRPVFFGGGTVFTEGVCDGPALVGMRLVGSGAGGVELNDSNYSPSGGSVSGVASRIVRLDNADDGPVVRLGGLGDTWTGLQFFRTDWRSGGVPPGHNVNAACVEIEAHAPPPTGRHWIDNCQFFGAGRSVRVLAGYYDGGGHFVPFENNGDLCSFRNIGVQDCDCFFECDNAQSVSHSFDRIFIGESTDAVTAFRFNRGGKIRAASVFMDGPKCVLLDVRDGMAPNANSFIFEDFQWDQGAASAGKFLTLFRYSGTVVAASDLKWRVRCVGHINNPSLVYDESKLIDIFAGAVGFPKSDLLFDVTNLPLANFSEVGFGPWYKPN